MAKPKRSKAVDDLLRGALAAARGRPMRGLKGKRLLLVDDQPDNLERLLATLRQIGGDDLEISSARTSDAAIDICLAHGGGFDIVLLNYLLDARGDTGIELLATLHRAGLPADAKSVLYSFAMSPKLRARALAAGFDDTLHCDDIDAVSLRMTLTRLTAPAERDRPHD